LKEEEERMLCCTRRTYMIEQLAMFVNAMRLCDFVIFGSFVAFCTNTLTT